MISRASLSSTPKKEPETLGSTASTRREKSSSISSRKKLSWSKGKKQFIRQAKLSKKKINISHPRRSMKKGNIIVQNKRRISQIQKSRKKSKD